MDVCAVGLTRAKIQTMRIRSATCHCDVHTWVNDGAIALTMLCRYFIGICINGIEPFALIKVLDDDVVELLLSLSDDELWAGGAIV